MLLTTGVRLDREGLVQYVNRLADAGAAGIGFATDVAYGDVPAEVVAAADACGLPVVEIPYETPFVAIAKTVSARLAAERYEGVQRAVDSQRRLIRATLEHGGLEGVARELASALRGWCAVTDGQGRPLVASPAEAAERTAAFAGELHRVRHGHAGAMGVSGPEGAVAIHPLGAHNRIHGFLISGRDDAFGTADQTVLSAAVTLLTLEFEQARASAAAARQARAELVKQVLLGELGAEPARRHLLSWGLEPSSAKVLVVLAGKAGVADTQLWLESVEERFAEADTYAVAAVTAADELTVITSDSGHLTELEFGGWAGLSEPAYPVELPRAYRQAQQAARVGLAEGKSLTRFDVLDTLQLLWRLQPDGALDVFAGRVLGPLEAHDAACGDELVTTVRMFVDHLGVHSSAAAALGIHRHTLRSRLSRAERLLDHSLDSPYGRLELTLALRARELS